MERPIERRRAATSDVPILDPASLPGKVVLVLQGGGALGSHQAAVCRRFLPAGRGPAGYLLDSAAVEHSTSSQRDCPSPNVTGRRCAN